jgi:peptide/nickel transport system permease protein
LRVTVFKKLQSFLVSYCKDTFGVIGLIILGTIIALAVLAPYLPIANPVILAYKPLQPPSLEHPMGTDTLGRDILSRVIWGGRTSITIGFMAAFISLIVGLTLGGVAGYCGGLLDDLICRITDIFLVIPVFFLALFIVAIYGGNIFYVMAVIGFLIWPSNARITRAQVLTVKEREFVQASKVIGLSDFKILFYHIIPNSIQPVIANTILQIAGAIITEAGLSFLGLGDPNAISWGRMIRDGQSLITTCWWISLFPGLMLLLTTFALHLIGDAISRVLSPKMGMMK